MSRHPLQTMPQGSVAVLPPQLFGSVAYYSLAAKYEATFVDDDMRFDKRAKAVHRYAVADTRGRLDLTVPVSKESGACPWSAVAVSSHGRWWDVHRVALESAYGRTPFFEFYIDRFLPLFEPRPLEGFESVTSLCRRADALVRRILTLPDPLDSMPEVYDDYRRTDFASMPAPQPYRQVREQTFGFIDRLSVLDLIFSLGPEAPLYLRDKS